MTRLPDEPEKLLQAEIEAAIDAMPPGDLERLCRLYQGSPLEHSPAVDRSPLLRVLDDPRWGFPGAGAA